MLEGSLLRGEARIAQLAGSNADDGGPSGVSTLPEESSTSPPTIRPPLQETIALERDIVALATPPTNKEEATERWQEFLRARFVRGIDEDFEYGTVDENEEYDTLARKDEEEAWFEEEVPDWASTEEEDKGNPESRRRVKPDRMLEGQTGIQDF